MGVTELMIKAVLFDLDGTLIDTNELVIKCFKFVYKKHLNLEVSTEDICKYFGEPLLKTFQRYDEKNAMELTEYYKEYNSRIHDEMAKSFEGAKETLLSLKAKGIKVGVVTSKRREMTVRGLSLISTEDIVDVLITPEDTNKHKPDPEPILKACERLKLSSKEVLYVGDTSFDIKSSMSAGASSCLVKYTRLPLEELMELKPNYTIDRLMDIIDIVIKENEENYAV
jgi:pyrophosphatase PpaX